MPNSLVLFVLLRRERISAQTGRYLAVFQPIPSTTILGSRITDSRPISAQFGPNTIEIAQMRPKPLGRNRPNSFEVGPTVLKFGAYSTRIGQFRPETQDQPNLARIRPTSVRIRLDVARARPNLARGRPSLSQSRPSWARFCCCLISIDVGPTSANFGPPGEPERYLSWSAY